MTFYYVQKGFHIGNIDSIYQVSSLYDAGVRAVLRLDSDPAHQWIDDFKVLALPVEEGDTLSDDDLSEALHFVRQNRQSILIQGATLTNEAVAVTMAYWMEYEHLSLSDAFLRVYKRNSDSYPSKDWLWLLTQRYQQPYTMAEVFGGHLAEKLFRQSQSSIDHIHQGVYLSGVSAMQEVGRVQDLGIRAVLRLDQLPRHLGQWPDAFTLMDLPIPDSTPLAPYNLGRGIDFIRDQVAAGLPVLVHCQMGMSRSVTMVLGYLIRDCGMSLGQAYHLVHSERPIASPNSILVKSLIEHLGLPFAPDDAMKDHFLDEIIGE